MKTKLYRATISTPLGDMNAYAVDSGVVILQFADDKKSFEKELSEVMTHFDAELCDDERSEHLDLLAEELSAYFRGALTRFTVKLELCGTDFQRRTWLQLMEIPYAERWSYKQQAEAMGLPKSIRPMASANGRNRIAILIPCHRVVGSDGSLTGYSAGVERKRYLIDMENSVSR